jgi:NADH-quinone oxidoreductase subunit I
MLIKNKTGFFQRFYLVEILKGLAITKKHFLKNLFGKTVTIQYPEERRQYSDRFRGMHYIKATNGVENCTACMLCPTVCPAECIHIEAGEREDKEKYPVKFEIDVLRCCFCGMCEEACPKDAIKLSNIYEMSLTEREAYDKKYLMEQRGHK